MKIKEWDDYPTQIGSRKHVTSTTTSCLCDCCRSNSRNNYYRGRTYKQDKRVRTSHKTVLADSINNRNDGIIVTSQGVEQTVYANIEIHTDQFSGNSYYTA
jgi:hypothetical protein